MKSRTPASRKSKAALRRILCRCTGYKKIIEAVQLAGRFLRKEITPDQVRPDPNGPKIGVSHPRPSAMLKACGVAEFSADIKVEGAAELAVVHSPHAHARIKSIDTSAAEKMPGVIGVMTAKDIKGTNRLKMVVADRPVLCDTTVRYIGDPVAAVLAETREQALAAAQAVEVDYELLPVMKTPAEAMAEGCASDSQPTSPICAIRNRRSEGMRRRLSPNPLLWSKADFSTQMNHQAPLEPEACVPTWKKAMKGRSRPWS